MEAVRAASDLTAPVVSSGTHDIVVYDDKCPMCTFQMRLLSWVDLGRRLDFLPLSSPEVQRLAPQLKREDLLEAMHVLTRKGPIYRGARAIRYLSARIVLLWPLCVVLWIPGVIFLSELFYRFVSRNRQFLSKIFGCKGACEVLPERKRD